MNEQELRAAENELTNATLVKALLIQIALDLGVITKTQGHNMRKRDIRDKALVEARRRLAVLLREKEQPKTEMVQIQEPVRRKPRTGAEKRKKRLTNKKKHHKALRQRRNNRG